MGRRAEIWTYIPDGPYGSVKEFGDALLEFNARNIVAIYTIFQGEAADGIITIGPADLDNRVTELSLTYGPQLQRTRGGTEAFYLVASLVFDKL